MKKVISLWLSMLLIFGCVGVSAVVLEQPHLFRTSARALPGETLMLYGSGFHADTTVSVCPIGQTSQSLEPVYLTESCVGVVIPESWQAGAYRVQVFSDGLASEEMTVNLPKVKWILGDAGNIVTPGGEIVVIGNGFQTNNAPHVYLVDSQNRYECTVSDFDEYRITAQTADSIVPGVYTVSVETDYGTGEKENAATVQTKASTPTTDFSPDGTLDEKGATDVTSAIQTALNNAGQNGGGVVTIPRGRFLLSGTLTIPQNVTLRGVAENMTGIFWSPTASGHPDMIHAEDNTCISNLGISVNGSYGNVITGGSNLKVENVRVRANAYFHHAQQGKIGGTYSGPAISEKPYEMGSIIYASGNNIQIANCDLYATNTAFQLENAENVKILNTDVRFGVSPFQMINCKNLLIAQNSFSGSSLFENGVMIGNGEKNKGVQNMYFAHNSFSNVYGNARRGIILSEQEAIQLQDGWTVTENSITVADASQLAEADTDFAVLVLSGRGEGQYMEVAESNGQTITFAEPWKIVPNSSSALLLVPKCRESVIYANTFTDVGTAVYAEGGLIGAEIADNTFVRTAPFESDAGALWYNTLSGNTVEAGYRWGGENENLTLGGNAAAYHRGNVLRTNTLSGNSSVAIMGAATDTLLESNIIRNVSEGMLLSHFSQAYLCGNSFDNVTENYKTEAVAPQTTVSKFENGNGQLLIEPMAKQLTVWFDLPMNTATLNNANVLLKDSSGEAETVTVTAKSEYCCQIVPESALKINEEYTLELSSVVQDIFGNAMTAKSIAFTTAGHLFETKDFSAAQADGSPLSSLGDGGVHFQICLLNGGAQEEEVSFFMAFYADNGELIDVCHMQETIAVNESKSLVVESATVPAGADNMKLFVWTKFRPMQMVREMEV